MRQKGKKKERELERERERDGEKIESDRMRTKWTNDEEGKGH